MTSLVRNSTRRPYGLSGLIFVIVLVWVAAEAHADGGDPLPRVQCPPGYAVTVYAEGLASPDGLAFSPDGILYVAEETAGRVSRVESYGRVTPILGGLSDPEGIAFDEAGNLYVVEDVAGGRVIKMSPQGVTTTLATGRDAPEGVTWTPGDGLYITESNVQFAASPFDYRTHVSAVSATGGVTRVLTNTLLWSYAGIAAGPGGSLYVTNEASGTGSDDSVFAVHPTTGARTLFATGLLAPEGLRFSASGGFPLYVAEENIGDDAGRLSRVEADGSHSPLCSGFFSIEDVALDQAGRLYVSEDGSGTIVRITPDPPDRARAHAIILFIGDGMGEAHRTAARWWAVGQNGALAMDVMPFGSWTRTASADAAITDSAASATAIATGVKTNNGIVGQDPDGNRLSTILERAQAYGLAVGLITTTPLADATPAAFAAHVLHRSMLDEIARQMLETGVDVLLGGGEKQFLPVGASGCHGAGERTDGRDLTAEAVAAGYAYVCDAVELDAVAPVSTTHLLGLFETGAMSRPYSPSLAAMTQKAITILSQDPDGFFLMVEGGRIDWAAHANDAAHVISDTIGMDEAVAVAQAYAATAGNTLVLVTADHETGGMSVSLTFSGTPDQDGPFFMPGGTPFYVNWTSDDHTATDVPTTAQGPWAPLLVGTYDNTYIHDVMRLALGGAPSVVYLPLLVRSL
jgi:alkaline phosphatase